MMRLAYHHLILCGLLIFSQTQGQTIDESVSQIASDLDNNLYLDAGQPVPVVILIHRFTVMEDGLETTSDLSTHIARQLGQQLEQSPNFHVISSNKARNMVRSRDWKLEASSPSEPENLGSMMGAHAVCMGTVETAGERIKISALIKTVKANAVISDASTFMGMDALPERLAANTENHDAVDFTDLVDYSPDNHDKINLDVFVNHAPDNEYRTGEELQIYIQTDRSCYIKVLYRDSEGDDLILFPRLSSDPSYFQAGQVYEIPPADQYRIVASEPFGTECLKVFASTQPFGEIEKELLQVAYIRARGMRIEDNTSVEPAAQTKSAQPGAAYGEKAVTIRVVD